MNRIKSVMAVAVSLILSACGTQTPGTTAIQTSTPVTNPVTQPATVPSTTTPVTTSPVTTPATTTALFPQDPDPVGAFWPAEVDVITHLDSDGELDTVFFGEVDFRINGISYKEQIRQDVYEDDDPNFSEFIIVDLDTRDDHRDIGLMVRGPSDDPAVFFYTIRGQDLLKLGTIPTSIHDPAQQFDGKGRITSTLRLSILQTWFADAEWELTSEPNIRLIAEQMYEPKQYDFMEPVFLKKDLPIYKKIGDAEPFMKLKPQEVEFQSTDNKAWVKVKGLTGDTGWFRVEAFDYLPDLKLNAGEAFDGLSSAD